MADIANNKVRKVTDTVAKIPKMDIIEEASGAPVMKHNTNSMYSDICSIIQYGIKL